MCHYFQAFVHLVKLQQEEAERLRQKEEEERKRKIEENKRRKRMLDAAFEGDTDEMKQILKEVYFETIVLCQLYLNPFYHILSVKFYFSFIPKFFLGMFFCFHVLLFSYLQK